MTNLTNKEENTITINKYTGKSGKFPPSNVMDTELSNLKVKLKYLIERRRVRRKIETNKFLAVKGIFIAVVRGRIFIVQRYQLLKRKSIT